MTSIMNAQRGLITYKKIKGVFGIERTLVNRAESNIKCFLYIYFRNHLISFKSVSYNLLQNCA